ncbi:MAG: TonB-dependent receptor [Campylobacter sp.]|nr:TonB-dependent receptor [Campylobacter sp.]
MFAVLIELVIIPVVTFCISLIMASLIASGSSKGKSSIERIEVIKGPMSTLYGSEALGGVVNIITKKVSDEWGASFGLNTLINEDNQWGNLYGFNIYADGPLIENKLGATFRYAQSYREKSNVMYRDQNGKEVEAADTESPTKANNYNIGTRLSYIHDDANTFVFDIDFARNHFDNREGEYSSGQVEKGGYEPTMDIDKLVTYLTHEGVYDGFTINSGIQYNRVTNNGRIVVANNNPYSGQNRDILAQDYIADTKAVIPIGQSNILSVGAEYKLEKMQDKIASPSRFSQYAIAAFAEDEYSILENLRLTLGARYNYHETFGNNISPRAYLVYNLNENFTFKGGVSTGFKAPTANKLIAGEYNYSGKGAIPVYGNPDLKEETSINYELGMGYSDDIFDMAVTGFITDFKDKISSISYSQGDTISNIGVTCNSTRNRCSQAINHGEVQYMGVEVSAGVRPISDMNLNLAYTYLDTEIKESDTKDSVGKPVDDSLKHNIVVKADYSINSTFTPWVKGEWQIDRYMGDTNINREYYKDIFLASLGVAVEINKNWNLNAGIYNLFDKDFTDGYVDGVNTYNRVDEGRRYYLSLNGRF